MKGLHEMWSFIFCVVLFKKKEMQKDEEESIDHDG